MGDARTMYPDRPQMPAVCRQHNAAPTDFKFQFVDGALQDQHASFKCGCMADINWIGAPIGWQLTESVYVKA